MKLTYIGAHDAVDLPLPGGGWVTVPRDSQVDVPDDFGRSLLEQADNWRPAGKPKPAAAADVKE